MVLVVRATEKRPDVRSLHRHLEERLHRSKFPQLIVYMDALPKTATNKLVRANFAQRANLPELTRDTLPTECQFEGTCPIQVPALQRCLLLVEFRSC